MSLDREQMIAMLQGELARRKTQNALPKSMENIASDQKGYQENQSQAGSAQQRVFENFGAAAISGLDRGLRGAVNLATKRPQAMGTPAFASDERLAEIDKRDAPMDDTASGFLGRAVGSTAATAPLGGGTSKVLATGGKLIKALASKPMRATIEGAVDSSIMANPEEQGEAGLWGAAAGLGLNRLGATAKRLGTGLVEKGAAAADLINYGKTEGKDLFVPVGQASVHGPNEQKAGLLSRSLAAAYKGLLPYFPGAGEQIQHQAQRLSADVEEIAIKQVDKALDPHGVGTLRPDALKDPQRAVKELGDKIENSYRNTIKSYSFSIPADMRQVVEDRIKQVRPDVTDTILTQQADEFMSTLERYTENGVMTGNNLVDAKKIFRKTRGATENDTAVITSLDKLYDEIVETQLQQGGKKTNLADLAEYKHTSAAADKFHTLRSAVEGAGAQRSGGHFTPGDLVDTAGSNTGQRELGQAAHAVTSKPAISVSAEGRNFGRATGLLAAGAGVGAGSLPGLAVLGATVGGANIAATQTAQKLLMGDSKTQKFIINALRNDPELAQQVGMVLRAGITSQIGDQHNGEQ